LTTRRADEGFTLVELLVTVAFLGVVVTIASTLLLAGSRTQSQVNSMSSATNRGEIVARSVETGVRNSSVYQIELPDANGSQLLRARVATGVEADTVTWQCQGWYYDAPSENVWTTTSANAIPLVTSAAGVSSWTLIAGGIELDGNADLDGDGLPDGNAQIFSGSVDELRLHYVVTDGDLALVLVPSTIVQQLDVTGGLGPTTCY
jgi:prepilin-type N-terminal cleavage/methylation domain-containing protein